MLIRQGFVYALRLKAQRQVLLRRWVGCRRFVFNAALKYQNAELAAGRGRPGYPALSTWLLGLKKVHPWLCEPPAQALQQALKDLCTAWERKSKSKFGPPRFKKRGKGDTIRLPQYCRYNAEAGVIHLPKLGIVRLRHSRIAEGALKNVTLRLQGQRWVAALQTEREIQVPTPVATAAVGLDFGVNVCIMPSAGTPIELPSRISRYERRIRRLQQSVSRKQRVSANRRKAVARLGACFRRMAAARRDFLHQETTRLVATHALIAIEDLKVKAMTASAVGTIEVPGKNVRAKSSLNRAILRNGWSMARSMLQYKAAWRGVKLVAVPALFTSQTCATCGHRASESRKTQALFQCVACGHTENADRNAAENILRRAQQQLARGSRGDEIEPGGSPAGTAGYAGTHACEGAQGKQPRPRPRSAAQGGAVRLPLAGTVSELSLFGNLHP